MRIGLQFTLSLLHVPQTAEEQVEPWVQRNFLEVLRGLNASVEGLLLPSRNIELEVKVRALARDQARVGRREHASRRARELSLGRALGTQALQDEADAAEAQALQVKQQIEERLMNMAHTVEDFYENIKQVRMHH